jgi:hypothetical protein
MEDPTVHSDSDPDSPEPVHKLALPCKVTEPSTKIAKPPAKAAEPHKVEEPGKVVETMSLISKLGLIIDGANN